MEKTYHFGLLEKELQIFAYPRVGSHFFNYCLSGLFDVISPRHPYLKHQEAIDRQNELRPEMLYALGLREPSVPFQPLRPNWLANGMHGVPLESEELMVVSIREPIATAYSRYRVERDRWGTVRNISRDWLQAELLGYAQFYDRAFEVLGRQGERGLLMRWEDLVASPAALEQLVAFVGFVPKLRPSFVWSVTRFENFVRPGSRTFYRSGNNDAWKNDAEWVRLLEEMTDLSFTRFGYLSIAQYLRTLGPVAANAR